MKNKELERLASLILIIGINQGRLKGLPKNYNNINLSKSELDLVNSLNNKIYLSL